MMIGWATSSAAMSSHASPQKKMCFIRRAG
jgi:hypothetical protein